MVTAQLLMFGTVGVIAALTHLFVVSTLVPVGMHPLLANVGGFVVALSVSYIGHALLTFPARQRNHLMTFRRFATVATLGFLVNECGYWGILEFTALDYRLGLAIILALVATGTFLLNKFWAFR